MTVPLSFDLCTLPFKKSEKCNRYKPEATMMVMYMDHTMYIVTLAHKDIISVIIRSTVIHAFYFFKYLICLYVTFNIITVSKMKCLWYVIMAGSPNITRACCHKMATYITLTFFSEQKLWNV